MDKLLSCCVPEQSKRAVTELLANEKHHYIEPHHGQHILPGLWEIGQAVQEHRVLEIEYERMKEPKLVRRRVLPVGIMFSEYYFYLTAFLEDKTTFENPDDLFQIGCIGLIKAVNNFNTELEVKFSTYAVPMIIGEIRRYMRDNNSIRVSRSLRDTAYKAIYAKENYMKKNQKEPTVQEIAEEIGISKEDIVFALDAIQVPMSLQEPVSYTHLTLPTTSRV